MREREANDLIMDATGPRLLNTSIRFLKQNPLGNPDRPTIFGGDVYWINRGRDFAWVCGVLLKIVSPLISA